MRRLVLTVLAASALLALPAAAESRDVQTARISLAAYDLQSDASVAALYQDITATAASICANVNESDEDRAWCAERAVERAIARANIPALSRYHDAHLRAGEPATLALR